MESIASWVAPIATITAVLITASNLGARITGYGFVLFTIGSTAWALLGVATDEPSLLWTNVLLAGLNLFGIWRWLGRESRIETGARIAAERSERTPGEALFAISQLSRCRLETADGKEIGECVDAMAGCRSGQVAYVVVAEGGVAGFGETFRRLPWSEVEVAQCKLLTRLQAGDFCTLEPLSKDQWPAR